MARPAGETALERITALLDDGSFLELGGSSGGGGVVTGFGTVDGRAVCIYSQSAPGSGFLDAQKIAAIIDHALRAGCPVVGLIEGDGLSIGGDGGIDGGIDALSGYGAILRRSALASGVVPQLAVVLGPTSGAAAQLVALTDFTVMVDGSARLHLQQRRDSDRDRRRAPR